MNGVYQHYIIDLSSNNNFVQIPTVQGDGNNIRGFEVELIENGVQYEIDKNDCIITIMGTKPDTSQVMNDCTVSDEGYILVDITSQMSAVKGRGDYQIVLMSKSTNSQLKSFPFYIFTTSAAFDIDYIVSTDEFQSLTRNIIRTEEVIDEANDAISDIRALETSVEKAEKNRVNAEKNRVNAEKDRATAESARQSNEDTRKLNELARQTAETNRNNAETERENAEETRISNENTRQNNEATRQSNENIRQTNTATAITNANKATERANKATEQANNAATICEGIIGESGIVAQKATEAADSATSAATSAANAKTSEKNAKTSETNASKSKTAAATSATNAANSASVADEKATEAANYFEQAKSYAVGGTGIRTGEDADNAKYYYEQAKGISSGLAGTLMPMGTVTFANLPALSSVESGWMYNISNQFTTTSNFKEGSGHVIPAGANVYKTADGKWDILAGTPVTSVNGQTGNVIIDTKSFSTQIVTTANTNLNDYTTAGIYFFASSYTPVNIPNGKNGWLVVIPYNASIIKQIWLMYGSLNSNYMTYVRVSSSASNWSEWKRYAMSDEVDSKVNKSGDSMEGILNLKDELRINDGVTNRRVILLRNPATYGTEVLIGGGGNTFIGSGESYYTLQEDLQNEEITFASEIDYSPTAERLYLSGDSNVYLLANCNNHGSAIGYCISAGGHLIPTGQSQNIGNSSHPVDVIYAKRLLGNLTGNADTAYFADNATKLATARNIAITNDMVGSGSFDGSANLNISVQRRGTVVGQSAATVANPWYQVAKYPCIDANYDGFISFHVWAGFNDKSTKVGILTAHFRTGNTVGTHGSAELVWEYALSGINTANFVLVYNATPGSVVNYQIWVKCDVEWQAYHFDVISEGNRSARHGGMWDIHSNNVLSGGGSATLPTGYTQITSVLSNIENKARGDYLPLTGGILKGHVNVDTDNKWIFGGEKTNLLNVYTRNIESTTSNNLYIKSPGAIFLRTSGVAAESYDGTGYVSIVAKAFNTSSSKRVKENIQDMTAEEASKILDINVVTFDYIARAGGDKNQRGCIAEDVANIIPSVVNIPEGYDDTEEFEDGKMPQVPGIDYSKFVPYLIKMVQIQNERIDILKKEIEMLKNN